MSKTEKTSCLKKFLNEFLVYSNNLCSIRNILNTISSTRSRTTQIDPSMCVRQHCLQYKNSTGNWTSTIFTAEFSYNSTNHYLHKRQARHLSIRENRELTQDWCQWKINSGKNKQLVMDFCRHKHTPLRPGNIQGMGIEIVET